MKVEEIGPAAKRELALLDSTVKLPCTVDEALTQWREYQELTRKLLDESDYQKAGDKKFKKKSAWRKYARAFNISDEVVFEHIERGPDHFPLYARVRVRATASNGRTEEADHECHVKERCCKSGCWFKHDHCDPDCDGRIHWAHPGDLPATALTRAKNRAISDLIGAGEVSAEEISDEERKEKSDNIPNNSPRIRSNSEAAVANAENAGKTSGIEITGVYLGQSPKGLKLEVGDREPEWYPKSAVISPRKWDWKEGQGVTLTIAKWLAQSKGFVDKEPLPPDDNIPY